MMSKSTVIRLVRLKIAEVFIGIKLLQCQQYQRICRFGLGISSPSMTTTKLGFASRSEVCPISLRILFARCTVARRSRTSGDWAWNDELRSRTQLSPASVRLLGYIAWTPAAVCELPGEVMVRSRASIFMVTSTR